VRVRESFSRDLLRLFVWYPLRLVAERLPPRAAMALYRAMGRLHAALSRGRAGRLAAAARAVHPALVEAGAGQAVVEAFAPHYVNQLIVFQLPRLSAANFHELLDLDGLDRLGLALAHNRGAVIPIGHFGPTQLPLAALGALGFPMIQIGHLSDEGLSFVVRRVAFRLRAHYEARIPASIVPPGPGVRQALAHLRAGGVVMPTADDGPGQPPFGHHATVDFPGGALSVPLGPARLALSAGAVLVPGFLEPGRDAPFRFVLDDPIVAPQGMDRDAAALAMTREFMARYATRVAARPGWWHGLESHLFP